MMNESLLGENTVGHATVFDMEEALCALNGCTVCAESKSVVVVNQSLLDYR